jgi:hypothetical protein
VVIESVVPQPAQGTDAVIVIRNEGGQTANLTNYRLGAADVNSSTTTGDVLTIASTRACRANSTLEPGEVLVVRPRAESNECGYPFTMNAR